MSENATMGSISIIFETWWIWRDLVLFFFVGGRGVGLVVSLGDNALEICR
ncbi:hypothetical protein [Bacillus thuringiensis]|nr:hypothetical protein [Bacillus thuringiensis]